MKTIKQIADEIGVSKQAVYKRVKGSLHTVVAPYAHTVNGIVCVSDEGETLIKQAFSKDTAYKTPHTYAHMERIQNTETDTPLGAKNPSNESNFFDSIVAMLQRELDAKNDLIAEQSKQITALTTALENTTASLHAAQLLHGGTMQKHLADNGEDKPLDGVSPQPKEGFFKRLFGRK